MRSITKMRIKNPLFLVAFLLMLYIGPMIFISSYGHVAIIPTEPNMIKDFSPASEWYDSSWLYRKSILINGSSGAGTDYQVLINVTYNSNMQADFDDLRFTDDDGSTLLDYWIESYVASTSAVVWVKVSDDLGTDQDIFMYYGNSTCASTSSGDDTFNLFSDFNRFMDLDTWSRYSSSDDFVFSTDVSSSGALMTGEAEGLAYDGTYYYISIFNSSESKSWLYKVDNDYDVINYVELTDSTLIHSGGIVLYNDTLYVPIAEAVQNPANPSKIQRYDPVDLSYIDTVVTSASYSDDHWGGVVIIPNLDRMYVGNWGTDSIYVFQIDGTYVTTITDEPDTDIQDFVYIEKDNLVYGSKQTGSQNIISVWKPSTDGNDLTFVGETETEATRTYNGFTWYDESFYFCRTDASNNYIFQTANDLELEIFDYHIYNDTLIGPDLMFEANVKIGGNRKFNMGWSATVPFTGTQILLHNSDGNINIYEGNDDDDTGFDIDQDTWTTLSLGWTEDNATAFKNRGSKHQTDDVDITGDSLKPQIALWGSADTPIYVKWLFIREYILDEPEFDAFGEEDSEPFWHINNIIEFVFPVKWTPEQQFGYDAFFIFLGLIMIPVSTMYLVRGGRKDMSADKFFYGVIIFAIGVGFLIGGILP